MSRRAAVSITVAFTLDVGGDEPDDVLALALDTAVADTVLGFTHRYDAVPTRSGVDISVRVGRVQSLSVVAEGDTQ